MVGSVAAEPACRRLLTSLLDRESCTQLEFSFSIHFFAEGGHLSCRKWNIHRYTSPWEFATCLVFPVSMETQGVWGNLKRKGAERTKYWHRCWVQEGSVEQTEVTAGRIIICTEESRSFCPRWFSTIRTRPHAGSCLAAWFKRYQQR